MWYVADRVQVLPLVLSGVNVQIILPVEGHQLLRRQERNQLILHDRWCFGFNW
ncbi:hypothetical protein BN8_02521 [Fibrisoma limi BUZ 3]|uniref:Uncharacterized protein n=1 Tax=Fibrisoma limi BUZ 3 TaxID=1185876 RepID=I2GHQ1_9BACT|nr:hypothetical protein BN8_02521 [Fibrisoma limi BUZ 3]